MVSMSLLKNNTSRKELCHKKRYSYLEGTGVFCVLHGDLSLPIEYGFIY